MKSFVAGLGMSFLTLAATALSTSVQADQSTMSTSHQFKTATLAGGCFWCTESDFEKLDGVIDVVSGYSGGALQNPTYKQISSGTTGHIEVIQVTYNPEEVTYAELLDHLWRHIDPTDAHGSFVDRGPQYRPAIFYHNDEQLNTAKASIKLVDDAKIFNKPFATELIEFKKFWPAEDYHQDYYKNNPLRYKYYRYRSGRDQFLDTVFGEDRRAESKSIKQIAESKGINTSEYGLTYLASDAVNSTSSASKGSANELSYSKPSDDVLRKQLTPLQYEVTQNDGTERPFKNEYWDNKEHGIYVDIVSGEPLFSSTDKYKSGTGWPSFTQPINKQHVIEKTDYKLFFPRTEVRSKFGDSHLGHVFEDGPAPTGLRYCINSAALKFIPVNKLQSEGYGQYSSLFQTASVK